MKTRIATALTAAALLVLASCSSGDAEESPVTPADATPAEKAEEPEATETEAAEPEEAEEPEVDLPDHNAYLLEQMGYESWDDADSDSWGWCVADVEAASVTLVVVHTECTAAQLPDSLANSVWNFLAYSDEADSVDWVEVMDASGTHYEQMHRSDNPLASN